MSHADVAVLGSANADLVVHVDRRPQGGETLLGSDLEVFPGGKGANQAAAAGRAGAATLFVGCVGDDEHGRLLRQSLADAGVDTGATATGRRPTGTALIFLTPDGENSIVVSPGANGEVGRDVVEKAIPRWGEASVLVLSAEIPADTVRHAALDAAARGVRVVLNAAPALELDDEVLAVCDPLVVNEHEAEIVLGESGPDAAELAARLRGRGARSVVITVGAAGAIVADDAGVDTVPAHRVDVVDTTGAGDAFVGAAACELARGADLLGAVRFATAMSALAVQRMGAASSYPSRAEVLALLDASAPSR